jgi:hypothetical protein
MDLATKGEAPFANLVKMQVVMQPPQQVEGASFPNGGRKSLLFSDGRQKAARLARDIPREVELDSFRQALALAARRLQDAGRDPRLNRALYIAFVSVVKEFFLNFFDREDQRGLRQHVRHFDERYDGQLLTALDPDGGWEPGQIPNRYREALLRQLCSPFYSLFSATVAYVTPSRSAMTQLETGLRGIADAAAPHTMDIASAWIYGMLDDLAFDSTISDNVRGIVAGYPRNVWGSNGEIERGLSQLLAARCSFGPAECEALRQLFLRVLCDNKDGLFFLEPNQLRLQLALTSPWFQCPTCTFIGPIAPLQSCFNCGAADPRQLDPLTSEYIRSRKGFWRRPIIEVLEGSARPVHITADEHTAQLSQRDKGVVYATTERYELRFQDIVIDEEDGPIDVLSCTTTMEVGVDIGSLVAIGLRNVPPQRENYQQRAGRAGRRGAAVSTVITYGQGGPHDSHFFFHPREIVSGEPRLPMVKIDNEKIARRHVHSYLFQTFFHNMLDAGATPPPGAAGALQTALGTTRAFFSGDLTNPFTFEGFRVWSEEEILSPQNGERAAIIAGWLPPALSDDLPQWVRNITRELLNVLDDLRAGELLRQQTLNENEHAEITETDDADPEESAENENTDDDESTSQLLDFLFDQGILPTYAFPRSLSSFLVERFEFRNGRRRVVAAERPQQSAALALSEYAPGRLIVIDKKTYRSGGVAASALPSTLDRAAPLFQSVRRYTFCPHCTYVQDPEAPGGVGELCPLCGTDGLRGMEMISPATYHPENGRERDETDHDQEFTYATSAQFPVPVGDADVGQWENLGVRSRHTFAADRILIVVNKGKEGDNAGFDVCDRCGIARVHGQGFHAQHRRPYLVETRPGQRITDCDGNVRHVFLGHTFRSDLMIWRLDVGSPLATNVSQSVVINALNDALRTLADGLLLAASRWLEVDANEFSVGFRIVPGADAGRLRADIYLFDTLSGGAGYSDQVGRELSEILRGALIPLLRDCPGDCERSCYNCLRHYGNQFWHASLDRKLASALMAYAIDGVAPQPGDVESQAAMLAPLMRMLELDGITCMSPSTTNGQRVPLVARGASGNELSIGVFNGLLDDAAIAGSHPVTHGGGDVLLLNEYLLTRNLPAAYDRIKAHPSMRVTAQ